MAYTKRWGFGFGTIFSLIVVYFIFLYSREKSWTILAFASKWYLIIIGGLVALSIGMILLAILISLFLFAVAFFRMRRMQRKSGKKKEDKYIDADYEIKE